METLRQTVDRHNLMAKKALGQNFLLDFNIVEKIIKLSLDKQKLSSFDGEDVFEVGPGPGGLTRAVLSANPKTLSVFEMDERCIKIMEELKRVYPQLNIFNQDALKVDWQSKQGHIVSNLPYNISVPLLMGWLNNMSNYKSLTLMFQKEVADRIMADTGTKDYGRVSVVAQLQCNIVKLMDLNPECFTPAPKIWSSVLLFTPKESLLSKKEITEIEKLTAMAFGQRRKMIRQSLKSYSGLQEKLDALGIKNTLRAENLTPEQYLLLTK
ncbi:MAG: 16S rRNA (adenine(1518)-N(6)/adenine(1519)-N(6))-dimethyltransferase RsmA [Alphaproteobacteria bacterium]